MIFWKMLTKILLRVHNALYRVISFAAIKAENGVHPKHRLLGYHHFFLQHLNATDSVLDIGCGNGSLTRDLAKKAKRVVGIDCNEKYIAQAKKNNGAANIEYVLGDVVVYDFREKFDVLVLSNVLEHIEKRKEFLQKIKPIANRFLIRVPMLNRDWLTVYKKEMGVEYRLDKTHFIEYTLQDIEQELKQAGFQIKDYSIQYGEIWIIAN